MEQKQASLLYLQGIGAIFCPPRLPLHVPPIRPIPPTPCPQQSWWKLGSIVQWGGKHLRNILRSKKNQRKSGKSV